jgi:hypothetical protein
MEEKQPYLVASEIETDYPLLLVGGSSLVKNTPQFALQISSVASLNAKDDNNYDLLIKDLISCESGGNENRCGDSGRSCGILQFRKPTYEIFCSGDWLNSENQIKCAIKMIDMGLGEKEIGWMNCWRIMNLDKYL